MQDTSKLIRGSVCAMRGYTPGEQPSNPDIIKLNTNENSYPPSPMVRKAVLAAAADTWRLYPDPLCRELRRVIAELHQCDPAQVFIGNGSDEILGLCTMAFLEDDDAIGFFDPSYSLYPVLAEIRNVAAQPVPLNADFDWPDPDPLAAGLFLLTNPNAPSGRLYPMEQVAEFCRQSRGVVVVDEAYVDFARADCMRLALTLPNTLVLRSLSKSYALAGLRAGYAVGPTGLIDALYKIKGSYNVSRLTQTAAHAAILDQPYMRTSVERTQTTRQRLAEALTAMHCKVWPSEANFLWMCPPVPGAQKLYAQLKEQNILVRYFPGERTAANLRITIGTDAQTDRLLTVLKRLLAATLMLMTTAGCQAAAPWPDPVHEIKIISSADGSEQPAMYYAPDSEQPVPLLISLHTWSGNYTQPAIGRARWCMAEQWAFVHPNFRGPNNKPEAMGSDLAVQDILDAVAYAKAQTKIDADRIYLLGFSGGGHAALLLAGRAPDIWAGVSAWCPISDLTKWHTQSPGYGRQIEAAVQGNPAQDAKATAECARRSPVTYLTNATNIAIDIAAGLHDGHTGSVPVSQSFEAFNLLVDPTARLPKPDITTITKTQVIPAHLQAEDGGGFLATGKTRIHFRRQSANARITIFEGGHRGFDAEALPWLAMQRKGTPAVWDVSAAMTASDDADSVATGK